MEKGIEAGACVPTRARERSEVRTGSSIDAFTVVLEDFEEGQVTAHVEGKGAASWARDQEQIGGVPWGCEGQEFAYAVLVSVPTLVCDLRREGYVVDPSALTVAGGRAEERVS